MVGTMSLERKMRPLMPRGCVELRRAALPGMRLDGTCTTLTTSIVPPIFRRSARSCVHIAPSDLRILGLDDRDQVMEKSISVGEIGRGRAVTSS